MLHLRIARIDTFPTEAVDEPVPAWLGGSERLRWMTLAGERRREFVAGRRLLRATLARATAIAAEHWDIDTRDGAGPQVRGPVPLHASVSHRLGWVAAAVSDVNVGVDLEVARAARSDAAERAALMLAPDDLAAWHRLAADRREAALLAAWTAKEAWFKASAPGAAPWDFRRVRARTCAPAWANVRTWEAGAVHVAVCCRDAAALAQVACDGLAPEAVDAFLDVGPAATR